MSRLSYHGALKDLFFSSSAKVMAKTPDEALAAARRFGFSISMDPVSPDIPPTRLPEVIVEDAAGVERTFRDKTDGPFRPRGPEQH